MLAALPAGSEVLEIGVGSGALGARLAQRYAYTGVELDAVSAAIAAPAIEGAGGQLIVADVASMPDGPGHDLVCAFEVLEHLADDEAAARSWASRLRPGGRLLISVPAQPHRLGPWDVAVGHYRRYDREGLTRVLTAAGLVDVEIWMVGFPIGYLLEAARNRLAPRGTADGPLDQRTAASGRRLQPPRWSGLATWLLMVPFRWMQRPFERTRLGTGIVATAVRPADGR